MDELQKGGHSVMGLGEHAPYGSDRLEKVEGPHGVESHRSKGLVVSCGSCVNETPLVDFF